MMRRAAALVFLYVGFFGVCEANAASQSAIAMHGEPKYKEGFTHFDYVNPDAPKGGQIVLGVVGSFDSLNPFVVRGTVPQAPAFGLFASASVYESLMARSWDEPFSLYPLIAKQIDVAEDRSSITFFLDERARFSDGKPVTADDVIFSFTTLRDQGRPNHRTYYKKVEKAEKLDERSVRFTFKPGADGVLDREMPLIMGLMPVLPKHDWEGRPFNQTTLRPPVASGPYRITKVDVGRSVTLTRNPDYWGRDVAAEKGMYNFDEVRIDFYRDDSVALQAFKAGAFDLRREPDPKKWAKVYDGPAVRDGRIKLQRFQHGRTEAATGLILNTRRPVFQNAALRKAVSMAFDFGWINKTLFQGLYKRTESFFPNSELAVRRGPPEGEERNVLEKYIRLTPDVLTSTNGEHNGIPSPSRGGLGRGGNGQSQAENVKQQCLRMAPLPNPPREGEGTLESLRQDCSQNPMSEQYRGSLSFFNEGVTPATTDGSEEERREQLLQAAEILKTAGYTLRDAKLFSPHNEPVSFEVMLSDPMEEKVALEWARNLLRLGIEARVRTVDSAQYQARLNSFDYDVTTGRWFNSLSPGNEQMFFWSCTAAKQKGSRNYPGICDPVVDALAAAIPAAQTREALVATVRALDRVLMAGHYMVPFYHLGADQIAYWTGKLDHPTTTPTYGPILESWWGKL